jgi:hypothetical protein
MSRRWLAQRPGTRQWLHWDLPIDGEPLDELSGAGALSFTVAPEQAGLLGDDGLPVFGMWGTYLYLEEAGQIRWGGVVIDCGFDGPEWRVEAAGFSTYPHGNVFTGTMGDRVRVDPADLVRDIWAHLQGFPDGDLGVQVVGSTSARLGFDSELRRDAAKETEEAAKKAWDAAKKAKQPEAELDRLEAAYEAAKTAREALDDLVKETGGSYRLDWWDSPDCGREIERLSKEAPFEWVEEHRWNADKTDVLHTIRIADRLGRRATDLSFQQGINLDVVPFDQDGDEYASEVNAIGRGEGKGALRATAAVRVAGRLRRARLLDTTKDVASKTRLTALTRADLTVRQRALNTSQVVVYEHPNAPFGSFGPGDEIRVDADADWLGRTSVWQRIVGRQRVSDTEMVLDLEPA